MGAVGQICHEQGKEAALPKAVASVHQLIRASRETSLKSALTLRRPAMQSRPIQPVHFTQEHHCCVTGKREKRRR
jgi:hypothetical protein